MAFVHHRTARFGDTDPAGIVFFARVFEYAHEAFEDCLQAGDLPLQTMLAQADWAMPLIHAEADYRAPMRLGERLAIEVALASRSETSLTLAFTVRGADDGKTRATVRHVHVAVHRASFAKRAVPTEVLAAFARAGVAEG